MSALPNGALHFGQVTDAVFTNNGGMAFDFSSKSPVTLIFFYGFEISDSIIANRVNLFKQMGLDMIGRPINVVIIRSPQGNYFANFNGIQGICDSHFEMIALLNDKLYSPTASTRRAVVFADCGGAIPTILTGVHVHYHSINLTTPCFRIFGANENFLDTNGSIKAIHWMFDNLQKYRRWFDLTEFLEDIVENPNTMLNMHWASTITGFDKSYRKMADALAHKLNVTITDHVVPADFDGHLLTKWLRETDQLFPLILGEVEKQFVSLGISTKNYHETRAQ